MTVSSDLSNPEGSGCGEYTDVVRVGSQQMAREAITESKSRIVIVERGRPRSVLFKCPCGCGETVVLNVDRQAGRAWRLRQDVSGVTLMPSVWLAVGCRSHFVLWRSRVWWCRFDGEESGDEWPAEMDEDLRAEWRRNRSERRRD